MGLPDFLVIGAQRAGTTWLYNQIKEHPEICLGKHRKEIFFFNRYYNRGVDWYKSHFAHCRNEQIIGEVTPSYIEGENIAKRIYELIPEAKLIAILRNPIDKVYSHCKKRVIDLGLEPSFLVDINTYIERADIALYYKQIKRFLKYFPEDRIKILIFEEMVKNPDKNIRGVFNFIGVDSEFAPRHHKKRANPSYEPSFRNLYIFMMRLVRKLHRSDLSWIVEWGKKIGLEKLFMLRKGKRKKLEKIPQEAYEYLRNYYKEDLRQLSVYLNRDMIKFWGLND